MGQIRAQIDDDVLGKAYDPRIARRLVGFLRPYRQQVLVTTGLVMVGTAADLLAAVRAVESGEKPAAPVFGAPEPTRRPAPEPARQPRPAVSAEPVAAPGGPAPEAVQTVRRVLAEGGVGPTKICPPTTLR